MIYRQLYFSETIAHFCSKEWIIKPQIMEQNLEPRRFVQLYK